MKTLSLTTAITVLCMNLALANDPVAEQVNLTRDAVNVALEEFSQGPGDASTSADSQLKIAKFNKAASAALVKFEESVRQQILEPMGMLINQYNRTLANLALGPAREKVLMSMREQLGVMERNKSMLYRQIFHQLYVVLPALPVGLETAALRDNRFDDQPVETAYDVRSRNCHDNTVTSTVYIANSDPKIFNTEHGHCVEIKFNDLVEMVMRTLPDTQATRRLLLEDCFSSSCFYATQARFTIWKGMIEKTLAPDLVIRMSDGFVVTISRNPGEKVFRKDLLRKVLADVDSTGFINNLPLQNSQERLLLLTQIDSQLAQNSCRTAKRLSERLCQESREGCITAAEVALLKDRHARKASCL